MSLKILILNILFYIIKIAISAPSCINNLNFCSHCNTQTNLCFKCAYPEILIPDKNGGCIGSQMCFAGKNNCNECDVEGKVCKVCEDYFYPDENGGCSYSFGCEISYKGNCLKCKNGFALIGRELKICKSLSIESFKNCKNINYETGDCSTCNQGYYLTRKEHRCIKIENCYESILGNCISCNEGFYLNKKENKCEPKSGNFTYCKQSLDGQNCDMCDEDFYLDENGICIKSQYCSESEDFKCKKCISGYHLVNNNAFHMCTTTPNCTSIDMYTSQCMFCNDKYTLNINNYKCTSNLLDGPLKYCQFAKDGKCLKCDFQYFLGEDYKCSESDYCSESENGKCIKCAENYYLSLNNHCTKEEKCIYTKLGSCIECIDGYYYNSTNLKCTEMKDQFLNCKYSCYYNMSICCECKNNFYLFENDSLCYDNTKEEKFIKCAHVDYNKEKCYECEEGYYLADDNKCTKVENCKISKNENECEECQEFYCLDAKNQRCVDNDYLSEKNDIIHISCIRTNEEGTACAQCLDGYEVNEEGYCVDIDICEEKEDGKCKKCKDIDNEYGYEYCANEIFGCLESGAYNCLRCDNLKDLYECTECKEGYIKYYGSCLKSE